MPRLVARNYLLLHDWLAELWKNHRQVFGLLSAREQWYLHDYFVPSWTSMTEADLLAHREKVAAERRSLPQCAGRAVRKLNLELMAAKASGASAGDSGRKVVVRAVVQPQVDLDRMSWALRRAAEDLRLDPPA